jgi:nucleoside-diphosphate-sugar epimerase
VAHLAGEPGVTSSWGSSFDRYLQRNVLATQRLLEAVATRGVQRLVFASSSSVYGHGNGVSRTRGDPRPASPYGVTKLAAETLVGAYALTRGLSTVSLRYFSVYGPRQRPDMAAHRFIEALLEDRPLSICGDGKQVRDFTYVNDVVQATVGALFADLPAASVLDVASGRPTTVESLIDTLRNLVGGPPPTVRRVEERLGDVQHTEGEIDSTRAQLGWWPTTDLRTGLASQLRWHLTERDRRIRSSPGVAAAVMPATGLP